MTGIYMIHNKVNGHKYIGQAFNLETRLRAHYNELMGNYHHNKHLQNAWNKYGANNFEAFVLEICDYAILNEREIFWIDYYNRKDAGMLYNKTAGGEGLKNCSIETREKLRDAHLGRHLSEEHKQKISESGKGRKGKPLTDAQKKAISLAHKGKTTSEKQKASAEKLMNDRWATSEWREKMQKVSSSYERAKGWHHTEESKQKISNAGKRPCSQETKQKISKALKGRKLSETRKQMLSKCCKGKIWINNGIVCKMIYPEELQVYLDNGFKKGRIS